LEKIHFDFWPEVFFSKIGMLQTLPHRDCYRTNWSFRPEFSFTFTKGLMHTNHDAQMKKALLQIETEAAFREVNENAMTLQLAAQQDERKRIAQELHDTLLQGFTGIALKLDALTTSLPPALSKTKQQLLQALEQMDHYLEETRLSIWNLRSPTLQSAENLSTALQEASERALAGTEITLSFLVKGAARELGNVLEHHLLRVCEEALANVLKHARATRVEVVLDFTSNEVQLQIRDNGCGFEPTSCELSKRGHFGLLGIKERVASLFGVLSVDGAPGRGTRLLATIPTKGALRPGARRIPQDRYIAAAVRA
jgi:signal transduction histidine kinase